MTYNINPQNYKDRDYLAKLNSLTKYPSILTYHQLDKNNGLLLDEVNFPDLKGQNLVYTEKLDGTNSRIYVDPAHNFFLIGSREEWLTARGDIIYNRNLGIVQTLEPIALSILNILYNSNYTDPMVIYGEVYGGKTSSGSKNYTSNKNVYGYKVFDLLPMSPEWGDLLQKDKVVISQWRENRGQFFAHTDDAKSFFNLTKLEQVPELEVVGELPTSLEGTLQFLNNTTPSSKCLLDENAKGYSEGFVVRTKNRSLIAKVRYQDYQRTLKKRKNARK